MRFLKDKIYMLSVSLCAVMAYGYQITHCTIGADDICIDYYFLDGLGPVIGRWPFFVFSRFMGVDGISRVVPFLTDMAAVMVLILAANIFAEYIRRVATGFGIEFRPLSYVVFSCFFVSYSLIAQVWIYYLHNGIAIGYLLIGGALLKSLDVVEKLDSDNSVNVNKRSITIDMLVIVTCVCLAISFYESMISVFLAGIGIYLFVYSYKNETIQFRRIAFLFAGTIAMMAISIVIRYVIITILCSSLGLAAGSRQPNTELLVGFMNSFSAKLSGTIHNYFLLPEYQPVRLFMICVVLDLFFLIVDIVMKKRARMILVAIYWLLAVFSMSPFMNETLPYRTMQCMAVFVGFSLMLFTHRCCLGVEGTVLRKVLHGIPYVFLVVALWNNLCEINYSFFIEYSNNQHIMDVVDHIGYDLYHMGYDQEQDRVMFLETESNRVTMPYPVDDVEYYQNINQDLLSWAVNAFGNQDQMQHLFKNAGYEINTYEGDIDRSLISQIPAYPQDGYICKTNDCYIVRID